MKKFNIAALIGAVALVVLSFTGCPTSYADKAYDCLPVGDVIGDMNGSGIVLDTSAITTAKCTFTYANTMNAWGGGAGVCNWKIRKVAGDWAGGDYGFGAVTIGTLPAGVTAAGNGGNIQFKGLVDGTAYTIVLDIVAPTIKVNLQ